LDNWVFRLGCSQIFRLTHLVSSLSFDERLPLQMLSDRTILFIRGENRMGLGRLTTALYNSIASQKEMISLKTSRVRLMNGEALASYDGQVADFFHRNLQ
jgi:hypothetical protein